MTGNWNLPVESTGGNGREINARGCAKFRTSMRELAHLLVMAPEDCSVPDNLNIGMQLLQLGLGVGRIEG